MDRMKNSDEIKELQEREPVRKWLKRTREGISMEEVQKYRQKLEERNAQK